MKFTSTKPQGDLESKDSEESNYYLHRGKEKFKYERTRIGKYESRENNLGFQRICPYSIECNVKLKNKFVAIKINDIKE